MGRFFLLLSAILCGLSVGTGAFATHGLRDQLSTSALSIFATATRYQMYHALGLGLVALLLLTPGFQRSTALHITGYAFLLGIVMFCGSLYGLSLTRIPALGLITPLGGAAFLIGWISLGIAAWNHSPSVKA